MTGLGLVAVMLSVPGYGNGPVADRIARIDDLELDLVWASGSYRVSRGGSGFFSATLCRVACRNNYYSPSSAYIWLGFRLVLGPSL